MEERILWENISPRTGSLITSLWRPLKVLARNLEQSVSQWDRVLYWTIVFYLKEETLIIQETFCRRRIREYNYARVHILKVLVLVDYCSWRILIGSILNPTWNLFSIRMGSKRSFCGSLNAEITIKKLNIRSFGEHSRRLGSSQRHSLKKILQEFFQGSLLPL